MESETAQYTPAQAPCHRIEPPQGWPKLQLPELWEYRELFTFLIWRDIKVRYKQTVTGVLWVLLQPILTMVLFTLLFGRLLKVSTQGIPYPLFAYIALVPWNYFSHAMTKSINSLTDGKAIITKIYFPRLLLPFASVIASFMDFIISLLILIGLLWYYGIMPGANVWALPFFLLMNILTALGFGLWLAAINVQYRDVANMLPFLLQIWLFVTPVAYSSQLISPEWRWLYGLNPMTGVVEGFRWCLTGNSPHPPFVLLFFSLAAVLIVFIGGLYYFRYKENYFADVI